MEFWQARKLCSVVIGPTWIVSGSESVLKASVVFSRPCADCVIAMALDFFAFGSLFEYSGAGSAIGAVWLMCKTDTCNP